MRPTVNTQWDAAKCLIMLALLLSFPFFVIGQSANKERTMDADAYRMKSKNLRTVGFVTLGVGSALLIGGATWAIHDLDTGSGTYEGPVYMILGGAGVAGASIPLFIASGVNAKRSKQLSLNLQLDRSAPLPMRNMVVAQYPAIALKWTIR